MKWLALIPPLITIIITFKTKKLIPALFIGVVTGAFLESKSLFGGITSIGTYIIDAVANADSAFTLGFLIAFGALAELIEMAGGISGFSDRVSRWIKNEKQVFKWAWFLSIFTFFDSSFHTIAVGTMLSPVLKKVNGSKEKFAFLLSVTSLQLILLIPIATAYLGYMVTLVTNNIRDKEIAGSAYSIVVKSVLWNFFSWSMIIIAIVVTFFGIGFGKIRLGKATEDEHEFTKGHIEKEQGANKQVEEYPERSRNLLIPVIVLLLSTFFFFWWTGKGDNRNFIDAISSAKFNVSIFAGVIFTILFTGIYFLIQKITLAEIEAHIIKGAEKVVPLIIILVLSWALTIVTEKLGFNQLIGEDLIKRIPKAFIPSVIFLFAAIIAYTIGSSWATWALIMPMAVNFAITSGVNIEIMVHNKSLCITRIMFIFT